MKSAVHMVDPEILAVTPVINTSNFEYLSSLGYFSSIHSPYNGIAPVYRIGLVETLMMQKTVDIAMGLVIVVVKKNSTICLFLAYGIIRKNYVLVYIYLFTNIWFRIFNCFQDIKMNLIEICDFKVLCMSKFFPNDYL